MTDAVDEMLGSARGFTVAAAGCGKTFLLGKIAADDRSGRQLLLTHTHAGVAAMKRRLREFGVPTRKVHVETIDGWCLRYAVAYPAISGLRRDSIAQPTWSDIHPAADRVIRSDLGRRVLLESYDGVLVDEYQDCTRRQHQVINSVSEVLPCRGVGDLLQSVFGFGGNPCVSREDLDETFEILEPLEYPWRWFGEGCNGELGDWLVGSRRELEDAGHLVVADDAPVRWVKYEDPGSWAKACWQASTSGESTVAIVKWPNQTRQLARRLGGRWTVVERFDDPDLFSCSEGIAAGNGPEAVRALFGFLSERVTGLGTDLNRMTEAVVSGRSVKRFRKNSDHLDRLCAMADSPRPETTLAVLNGVLQHDGWSLYRKEDVYQLRAGLQDCLGGELDRLPEAVAAARVRARHRGRRTSRRTIGTPLLVKGLEFEHAVVLWDPQQFSLEGLYVAITRGSKSLTIVSRSRLLTPT